MATSKLRFLTLALLVSVVGVPTAPAREAASASACQAAASQPAIAAAKAGVDRDSGNLRAQFTLADAWSDAGCFNDALQVLQGAEASNPGDKELETRLRVAKSLVGEERYFDDLDRANTEARLKRDTFRCTTLSDLDACGEAVRIRPDDPSLLVFQGDAYLHAKRPADAVNRYRLAAALLPNQPELAGKITAAEAELPARSTAAPAPAAVTPAAASPAIFAATTAAHRYSNAAPESRSH